VEFFDPIREVLVQVFIEMREHEEQIEEAVVTNKSDLVLLQEVPDLGEAHSLIQDCFSLCISCRFNRHLLLKPHLCRRERNVKFVIDDPLLLLGDSILDFREALLEEFQQWELHSELDALNQQWPLEAMGLPFVELLL